MAEAVGLQGENAKDDYRKMETGLRAVTGPVLVAAECLVALQAFAEVAWWAERNGHDLTDFDMLLRGPADQIAGHLQAQSADFLRAAELLPGVKSGVVR
jgi:hypothetical protein